jgi:hypothetical protein
MFASTGAIQDQQIDCCVLYTGLFSWFICCFAAKVAKMARIAAAHAVKYPFPVFCSDRGKRLR